MQNEKNKIRLSFKKPTQPSERTKYEVSECIKHEVFKQMLKKYSWPVRHFLLTNILAEIKRTGTFDPPIRFS